MSGNSASGKVDKTALDFKNTQLIDFRVLKEYKVIWREKGVWKTKWVGEDVIPKELVSQYNVAGDLLNGQANFDLQELHRVQAEARVAATKKEWDAWKAQGKDIEATAREPDTPPPPMGGGNKRRKHTKRKSKSSYKKNKTKKRKKRVKKK